LTLQDRDIDHPLADKHLHSRWSPASPLHRAGRAVFVNLLERGLDPAQLHRMAETSTTSSRRTLLAFQYAA
jgi:hypothetical protein